MSKKSKKQASQLNKQASSGISALNKHTSETGTPYASHRFYSEYLGALQHIHVSADVYDRMRRSDPQINRVLRAIKTPIEGARFTFSPLDPTDEKQKHQANFKTNLIYEYMDKSFTETLKEILSYLVFGFSAFEPIYDKINTKEFGEVITLKKLAFISQKTIREWDIEDGEVKGITQLIYNKGMGPKIDASNFIFFVNDKEGDNFEGISILRGAYGSWYRKDLYLKMDMIGIEKMAIGVPIMYVPPSIFNDDTAKSEIQAVLESYTGHEKQYLILPDELKDGGFTIQKGEYDSKAVNDALNREDMSILSSVLASFLEIGTQRGGGNAQSSTLYQMFIDSIEHIGSYICEKLSPLIHQVYVWNFGEPDVRLDMECTNISKKNEKEIMDVITGYAKSGLLTPDHSLEAIIRSRQGLPEVEEPVKSEPVKAPEVQKNAIADVQPIALSEKRELTQYEKSINLSAIESLFTSTEDQYRATIKEALQKAKAKFLHDLRVALGEKNKLKAVLALKAGFMGQLAADMRSVVRQAMIKAKTQAGRELSRQKLADESGVLPDPELEALLGFTVNKAANDIGSDFEKEAVFSAVNELNINASTDQIVASSEVAMDDFIDSSVPYNSTGAVVNKFINLSWVGFFFSNKELIQGFQFSAILDSRTTPLCASLDKKTFSIDDTSNLGNRPPLHWNCRSILVPILIDAETPQWTGLEIIGTDTHSNDELLKYKQF